MLVIVSHPVYSENNVLPTIKDRTFALRIVTVMTRRFVRDLNDGETIDEVYLVSDKQLRANRNGNLYILMELRDRTGAISARQWNAGEKTFRSFNEGDFVQIQGKVQMFQGSLQVIANSVEVYPQEKVDVTDFLPHTERDVIQLRQRLQEILRSMENMHLRALAECFLLDEDLMRGFCRAPAGIRNHHAYVGGLLEHVVTLLEGAERLLPLYPKLNRDLLLIGIFLHDIGKTRELSYERVFGYTDEGQMIGHLVIGVEMVQEKLGQVADFTGEPFPPELLLRVKHLIVSHHGTYEFGSPKLPMFPEAIALHFLDNFDAKVHTFVRDIEDDHSHSAWTPFSHSFQRRLYKGPPSGGDPSSSWEDE